MYICKQNKFQQVHLYAEQDRDKAGRCRSIWKQQFQKSSFEKQNSGDFGKHSQAICSYSGVVPSRFSLMTTNDRIFCGYMTSCNTESSAKISWLMCDTW